jgi:hypothetical protein
VGDRNQTTPLHLLSPYNSAQPAKSLWTDELEAALLDGRMDILVHSCKDVPTLLKDGCEIAALPQRHDPRDALVVKAGLPYTSLDQLPDGAVIGTGSVRRIAQLRRAYPALKFDDMVSLHVRRWSGTDGAEVVGGNGMGQCRAGYLIRGRGDLFFYFSFPCPVTCFMLLLSHNFVLFLDASLTPSAATSTRAWQSSTRPPAPSRRSSSPSRA